MIGGELNHQTGNSYYEADQSDNRENHNRGMGAKQLCKPIPESDSPLSVGRNMAKSAAGECFIAASLVVSIKALALWHSRLSPW